MRTTLILEVSDDISEFIKNQHGLVDPSALVNKLLREEKDRQGFKGTSGTEKRDDVTVAMEEFLDENTHAAG